MGIVSYAQNFEDVMLWRALNHIQNGFYIDIGARDPIVDSVSKVFYDNGWRGVEVEALPGHCEILRKSRPNNLVIQAAISEAEGNITFYEIENTGISTGILDIALEHSSNGFAYKEVIVPSLTIDQIFAIANAREVHWMKIDVEGMEDSVISGWHSKEIMPWVLVIEGTLPCKQVLSHHDWESKILQKGYVFTYFDGLNRFYVSKAHVELIDSFANPPNVFDDFTLSGKSTSSLCSKLIAEHNLELSHAHNCLEIKVEDNLRLNDIVNHLENNYKSVTTEFENFKIFANKKNDELLQTISGQKDLQLLLQDKINAQALIHAEQISQVQKKINELNEKLLSEKNKITEFNVKTLATNERLVSDFHERERRLISDFRERENKLISDFYERENRLNSHLDSALTREVHLRDQILNTNIIFNNEKNALIEKNSRHEQDLIARLKALQKMLDKSIKMQEEMKNSWIRRLFRPLRNLIAINQSYVDEENYKQENVQESKTYLSMRLDTEINILVNNMNHINQLLALNGEKYIEGVFIFLLGRRADENGLKHYYSRLNQGYSKESVIFDILASREFKENNNCRLFYNVTKTIEENNAFLDNAYCRLLGRHIDPTGLNDKTVALNNGVSRTQILNDLFNSPEAKKYRLRLNLLKELKNEQKWARFWPFSISIRFKQLQRNMNLIENSINMIERDNKFQTFINTDDDRTDSTISSVEILNEDAPSKNNLNRSERYKLVYEKLYRKVKL